MISLTDLVSDILKKLSETGILTEVMLIGSWCLLVYQDHFENSPMIPVFRTTDIDFMIPYPPKISTHVDVPKILRTLDFAEEVDPINNVVKYLHHDLEIEFLIPEVGQPKLRNLHIAELKIIPQRLRYLNILQDHQLKSNFKGIPVIVPEPAAFVIQKFICSASRTKPEKRDNDLRIASELGLFLLTIPEQAQKLYEIYQSLLAKWRKRFLRIIEADAPKFFEKFNSIKK